MEGTPIYNLPQSVNTDWATSQEAFESQIREGLVGSIEPVAAHAAQLRSTVRQLPAVSILMGLYQRTRVATFAPFPAWQSLRMFSSFEAPSLGPASKLAVDKQRIQNVLETLSGKGAEDDYVAGLKVITTVDQIVADNHEIAFVQANRGALVAG